MVVDILILGAGWSSQFLRSLCNERGITYAATTRSGRESTIKFDLDPNSDSHEPYYALPKARVVLITFPIIVKGPSERLVKLYAETHPLDGDLNSKDGEKTKFIQFGTTGMWDVSTCLLEFVDFLCCCWPFICASTLWNWQGARLNLDNSQKRAQDLWYDRHSPFTSTPRAEVEDELLALSPGFPTTVLNLAGLWGGSRSPKNWVGRVAGTKEGLKNKVRIISLRYGYHHHYIFKWADFRLSFLGHSQGSLHVIHGIDVARAVLAVCRGFEKAKGQRWLLTDNRVYDWWDLASAWGTPPVQFSEVDSDKGPQAGWVRELMDECGVRALPRDVQQLGRVLDSREFWTTFGITPVKPLLQDWRCHSCANERGEKHKGYAHLHR